MTLLFEICKILAGSKTSGAGGRTSQAAPAELYHRTCEAVLENIFDPRDFTSIARDWRHKFDGRIKSESQAVTYANQMLAATGDPCSILYGREDLERQLNEDPANYCGIGITCAPKHDASGRTVPGPDGDALAESDADGHPLVKKVGAGTPAEDAGIKAGDYVTDLNGVTTSKERSLKTFLLKLRGKAGSQLAVGISRGRQNMRLTLTRRQVQLLPVSSRLLAGNIGYIEFSEFSMQSSNLIHNALNQLKDTKALIVDVRNNNGGRHRSAIDITSMFLPEGVILLHQTRIAGDARRPEYESVKTELSFDNLVTTTTRSNVPNKPDVSSCLRTVYMTGGKKVVLLVGENTASSAEIFAGALKDNGAAVLIGTRTYGKGVGQVTVDMPNRAVLEITNSRYTTPNGTFPGNGVHARSTGVAPDLNVEPQVRNFDTGSDVDNQLAAAVAYLQDDSSRG
jgi:carboxyl-terminal processing protease